MGTNKKDMQVKPSDFELINRPEKGRYMLLDYNNPGHRYVAGDDFADYIAAINRQGRHPAENLVVNTEKLKKWLGGGSVSVYAGRMSQYGGENAPDLTLICQYQKLLELE